MAMLTARGYPIHALDLSAIRCSEPQALISRHVAIYRPVEKFKVTEEVEPININSVSNDSTYHDRLLQFR